MEIILPISPNYVKHWGAWEAVREFLQNALDAGDATYKMEDGRMSITSTGSLEPKTLLLGETSKENDDSTIGAYGEGYKLALVVLARLGITTQIYTNGKRWTARFADHPTLGVKCLAVHIQPSERYKPGKVVVQIEGLTPYMCAQIREKFLPLSDEKYDIVAEFEENQILQYEGEDVATNSPDNRTRKVFVSGLFVTELPTSENYWYSYNLQPENIDLDRDRNRVSSWDLQYTATTVLTQADKPELLALMAQDNAEDISSCYESIISHHQPYEEFSNKVSDMMIAAFIAAHGDKAYPMSMDWGTGRIKLYTETAEAMGLKAVLISNAEYSLLGKDFIRKLMEKPRAASGSLHDKLKEILEEDYELIESSTAQKLTMIYNALVIREM